MVIVGVAAEYTYTINRHVQRSNTVQSAVAVGDSCIEILFANWRAICSVPGSVTTPQTTSQFASIPLPTNTQLNLPSVSNFAKRGTDFNPANDEYDLNYTISNYKVVAVDAEWNGLAWAGATPEPILGQIAAAISSTAPTTPLVYNYVASADVTLPALGPSINRTVVAKVRRVFQKQQLSPWNFAIFYLDPLEIHPGPPFTVTGWVHTNSDLYTGHDTLTFADKVTYGADWFVDFKPGETYHAGDTPASPHYPGNLPPARDQAMQPFGLDSTSIFNTSDTNPNNDSYHELIEQAVAGYTDPLAGQRYYDQAGIKILVDGSVLTPTVKIYRYDGTEVKFNSANSDDRHLYTAIVGALGATAATTPAPTTTLPPAAAVTIQDNRETQPVRLTTLDISAVNTAVNNGNINNTGNVRWNNIIYITDTSATNNTASPTPSPVHRGIRLKNGQILPNNGITVASANPVYIQGDYNTGMTDSHPIDNSPGTPPSNYTVNNDPTTPQVSGYTRQPASVVADAVNILSSSWDDTPGVLLANRHALPTTVNTAIVAGIVPSSAVGGDGNYSGGAENFPRFLEGWSGVTFTYYGSMVELYKSRQAIGEWKMPNVYDAPNRQWYFDTNFKIKPPPGSLMLFSYIKGKWSIL
jgi:hypothetical protein